jgi:hypothetical protein
MVVARPVKALAIPERHCHVNRKFAGQMTMAATASGSYMA